MTDYQITGLSSGTAKADNILLIVDPDDTSTPPAGPGGSDKQITWGTLIAALAPLASPAFTGNPTAPTQTVGDNSTKLATTAYADTHLPKSGGTMTGFVNMGANALTGLPNGSNSTDAVAFGQLSSYAPLASPALTGNPTAPTQSAGNNSTRLATTAYADGAIAALDLTWLPSDDGLIAASGDPGMYATSGLWTAGAVLLTRVMVRKAATISSVGCPVISAGSGASTGTYMGIYTLSGGTLTLQEQTADCATSFTTAGTIGFASLTSSYAASAGAIYCAVLVNMATQPGLGNSGAGAGSYSGTTPLRSGAYSSGLTSLPSTIPAASVGNAGGRMWGFAVK